jgi:cysteine desulfurase
MESSHVLRAMGVDPRFAKGALRLSLGHTTTAAEVERAVEVVVASVRRLRRTT